MPTFPQYPQALLVQNANYVNKSADYTATSGDFVLVDTSGGAVTITLPPVGEGGPVAVVNVNGDNPVVIATADGSQIEDTAGTSGDITFTSAQSGATFASDGTSWWDAGNVGGGGGVGSVSNEDDTITITGTDDAPIVSRAAVTGDVSIPAGSTVSTVEEIGGVSVAAAVLDVLGNNDLTSDLFMGGNQLSGLADGIVGSNAVAIRQIPMLLFSATAVEVAGSVSGVAIMVPLFAGAGNSTMPGAQAFQGYAIFLDNFQDAGGATLDFPTPYVSIAGVRSVTGNTVGATTTTTTVTLPVFGSATDDLLMVEGV